MILHLGPVLALEYHPDRLWSNVPFCLKTQMSFFCMTRLAMTLDKKSLPAIYLQLAIGMNTIASAKPIQSSASARALDILYLEDSDPLGPRTSRLVQSSQNINLLISNLLF